MSKPDPVIDFSQLMDLRVGFAFKLFFASGNTSRLVSLLNAISANKGIPRLITGLTVVNPALERSDSLDKHSILDIRATLSDGIEVCVEMHLYGLMEFKLKSIRNWARVYGEALAPGQGYAEGKPVICISFIDGPLTADHLRSADRIGNPFTIHRKSRNSLVHCVDIANNNRYSMHKELLR